jgi:hypothetical protein
LDTFVFKYLSQSSDPRKLCVELSHPVGCFGKVRTLASAGGPDNLVLLDPGKYKAKSWPPGTPAGEGTGSSPKWQIGEQEFEALMRMLDNLVRMVPSLTS